MKKITLLTLTSLFAFTILFAQQEKGVIGYDNWLKPWTEFRPNKVEYENPTQIISGNITGDKTLFKKDVYLLVGDIFVTDSTTLTIEPGTVIIADVESKASLIISRGSKIIANGTPTDPIVFTSGKSVKKAGDWGGIFILGEAPTNKFEGEASLNYGLRRAVAKNINYGGDNPDSNSGIFQLCAYRICGEKNHKLWLLQRTYFSRCREANHY